MVGAYIAKEDETPLQAKFTLPGLLVTIGTSRTPCP